MKIKITNFEEGKTSLVIDPNKRWDDDVATTSSRINYEIDGCKCGQYVSANNIEEAIKEILPKIILNEFLEHDYSFQDLGLSNPEYETPEGNGFITNVVEFLDLRNCEIHLIDEDKIINNLICKGKDLFNIEVKKWINI